MTPSVGRRSNHDANSEALPKKIYPAPPPFPLSSLPLSSHANAGSRAETNWETMDAKRELHRPCGGWALEAGRAQCVLTQSGPKIFARGGFGRTRLGPARKSPREFVEFFFSHQLVAALDGLRLLHHDTDGDPPRE